MKGRVLTPLLLASTVGCSTAPGKVALPSPSVAPRVIAVRTSADPATAVRHVPLEEYVRGTILSELAPSGADAALAGRMYDLQAIVSRTYAVANLGRHGREGYDLCATTHCQLYEPSRLSSSRWAGTATEAVRRTAGLVLWHQGVPARVVFHADCGGHTSAATSVWGGRTVPYLAAVPDDDVAEAVHRPWRYEAAHAAVLRALERDPRTRVGGRLDTIEVLDRDPAGRAERVALHGSTERIVRGEELREVLTRAFGARAVRSTRFTVRRELGVFAFEGTGFGHGVGLCQTGALARVRAGAAAAEVLERYFPGTQLQLLP